MNLSQKNTTIKPNTQLATAFLVDKMEEPFDKNGGEKHKGVKEGVCQPWSSGGKLGGGPEWSSSGE